MTVRDFYDQWKLAVQLYIIDDDRKFFSEFFRQENNPDLLIGQDFIQFMFQFSLFMNDSALNSG